MPPVLRVVYNQSSAGGMNPRTIKYCGVNGLPSPLAASPEGGEG